MRLFRLCVTLLGATLFLPFGCSDPPSNPTAEKPATPPQTAETPKYTEPVPVAVGSGSSSEKPAAITGKDAPATNAPAPGSKGLTAEEALKQIPALDPKFVTLQKTMDESEAALKKSPNDPKLKATYVEATFNYGHEVTADGRAPQVMYRAALALYRRALKVDPKHQPSLADKKTIEDIYTQMGRPIPE